MQIEWEALGNIFGKSTSFISTIRTKIDTSNFSLSCPSLSLGQLFWLPAAGQAASPTPRREAGSGCALLSLPQIPEGLTSVMNAQAEAHCTEGWPDWGRSWDLFAPLQMTLEVQGRKGSSSTACAITGAMYV